MASRRRRHTSEQIIRKLRDGEKQLGQGVGLAEVCKAHGFRYCPRLHIELYGNQRGR